MTRLITAGAAVIAALASTAAAAPQQVTIVARPTVLGSTQGVMLSGSVDSTKADEIVTIQAKDCGQQFFRGVAAARTLEGGRWSTEYFTGISTTLRAVWNQATSAPVTVRRRPLVNLIRRPAGQKLVVSVVAQANFWRKRALFQRFDPRLGKWMTIKSLVLTDTGSGGPFARASADFTTSLPRGTLVRGVFPLSQARPCYLAGVSKLLRT